MGCVLYIKLKGQPATQLSQGSYADHGGLNCRTAARAAAPRGKGAPPCDGATACFGKPPRPCQPIQLCALSLRLRAAGCCSADEHYSSHLHVVTSAFNPVSPLANAVVCHADPTLLGA